MQKSIFSLLILLLCVSTSYAHYLWIETAAGGTLGKKQEVSVFFGEYTYGVREATAGDAYAKVDNFKLWVVHSSGTKELLSLSPQEDHYSASFVPQKEGVYTLVLNNDEIEVIDYTAYDFGIFKTHYHAVAKVQVGMTKAPSIADNPKGITIRDVSNDEGVLDLQILYKDEALADAEVMVFIADRWSKVLVTDEEGRASVKLPWETTYLLEVTKSEEVPGNYKGEDYDFTWHCATYSLSKL